MIHSKSPPSSTSWRECCQHEEEIAILQEKLMELHNKLIDQLDVCKEQELAIIELTRRTSTNTNSGAAFDTFKYQSFGQHSHDSSKENQTPNYGHYHHDSTSSHHAKTELLQADLEAMRGKVLAEITEKNKLKEEVKEIRSNHKKEIVSHLRKIEGLESLVGKLREDNEQLREKCQRARRDPRADSEMERLAARLGEMEARYVKERDGNRELTQENLQLTEKLDELEREIQLEREARKDKKGFADSNSHGSHGSHAQYLKAQTVKIGRHNDYREQEHLRERDREREREREREKDRERERQKEKEKERERQREREKGERAEEKRGKKRGFEQTKELIKKLQQAQVNMRRNRKQAL